MQCCWDRACDLLFGRRPYETASKAFMWWVKVEHGGRMLVCPWRLNFKAAHLKNSGQYMKRWFILEIWGFSNIKILFWNFMRTESFHTFCFTPRTHVLVMFLNTVLTCVGCFYTSPDDLWYPCVMHTRGNRTGSASCLTYRLWNLYVNLDTHKSFEFPTFSHPLQ